MSRHLQRRHKFLENPEVAAGYWEMDSELRLIQALDQVRREQHLTTDEIARRMGRHREAVSRLLNAQRPNPTLETFNRLLQSMDLSAEIRLHRAHEGEPPITVSVDKDVTGAA